METTQEKQQRMQHYFNVARYFGLCNTRREFADFLGINENTIGRALNGQEKYLTQKNFTRIENALNEAGINVRNLSIGDGNQIDGHGNTIINAATIDAKHPATAQPTSDRLLDEMKAQREMYDRQLTELLHQNAQLIRIITDSK